MKDMLTDYSLGRNMVSVQFSQMERMAKGMKSYARCRGHAFFVRRRALCIGPCSSQHVKYHEAEEIFKIYFISEGMR